MSGLRPWSVAWADASREFWGTQEPGDHFSTSAGPQVAGRLAALVHDVDRRLDRADRLTIVDLGAGDGSLLAAIADECPDLAARAHWIAVDLRGISREGVESMVAMLPAELPGAPFDGVVMAHEWLDEIPCEVVERDPDGTDRLVLVDAHGEEMLGPELSDDAACAALGVDAAAARAWLVRWWPLHEPGDRAEIGSGRDAAWTWMTGLVRRGVALATDYGHVAGERLDEHRWGTLAAYRAGRIVRPVPDGSVGITAHVAVDACQASVPGTRVTRQRDELPRRPLREGARAADIEAHFGGLALRDRAGKGSFAWMQWERGLAP